MREDLASLVERLQQSFGPMLVSAILYGSAAVEEKLDENSDLNVLCVLTRLSPEELAKSEPIFRWWIDKENPPPLLLTEVEVKTSTDCFPMEFHDMQEHRRILAGTDVIRDLQIDRKFYRAQVEHELRAKQIRLRQKAAAVLGSPGRLLPLLRDSLSTFCVLGRHALVLSGRPARWTKSEILTSVSEVVGKPLEGANEILAVRTDQRYKTPLTPVQILERYLGDFEALVQFVDALE